MSMSTRPPLNPPDPDVLAWFRVAEDLDVFAARNGVRQVAHGLGFESRAVQELAIVVSELSSNILKHARRGWIRYSAPTHPLRGRLLRIEAGDNGPPFRDFAMAQLDGYDDQGRVDPFTIRQRRGIARGLGAVQRFSHGIQCRTEGTGKIIEVVRYVRDR
jgi:anti-sigma regulatory factor (Ser/Thr protein kinase)